MTDCPFKEGDRIRLVSMPDDPDPIPNGTTGTILSVTLWRKQYSINVKWDIDRSLGVIWPHDTIEKINE